MTKGIISAPIRQVKEEDQLDYIQTDSAINPGNSGGALVDINGRLVGINTFILSGSGGNEGLNFAIPSDVVQYIFGQLRDNRYVIRGTIGITTRNLTPELIRALKLSVQLGVYIDDVEPRVRPMKPEFREAISCCPMTVSPSMADGPGSRTRTQTPDIRKAKRGERLTWKCCSARQDEEEIHHCVDQNQSSPMAADDTPQLSNDTIVPQLGIYVLQVGPGGASALGLRSTRGVMVAAKVQSMTAAVTDLENRDLIVEVDGKPVTTQIELQRALDNADLSNPIAIRLERDKKYTTILVEIN
jgi:serine protease Do